MKKPMRKSTRFVIASQDQAQLRRQYNWRSLAVTQSSPISLYGWDRRAAAREYAREVDADYLVYITALKPGAHP